MHWNLCYQNFLINEDEIFINFDFIYIRSFLLRLLAAIELWEWFFLGKTTIFASFGICFQFFQFAGGLVQVVAVKVLADGPLAGKKLSEFRIHLPKVDVRVGIIFKNDKPIYPTGNTVVEVYDEVFFIATEENMRFMSELRKPEGQARNVMIAGGGNVGSVLAKNLESSYSV